VTPPPAVPDAFATLASGAAMPLLGFGTWQLTGPEATRATATALAAGYRHIDTAVYYQNETEIGVALIESGVNREDLFVTTKLPGNDASDPRASLTGSLGRLQTSYLDLWLIHWPTGEDDRVWDSFLAARAEGLVRDIGVSNFSLEQIDQLAARGALPAVNQICWSPLLFDADLLAGHQQRGVLLEGYSALRGGTLEHPVITEIAERMGRTAAQVILRWHLQHGIAAIPKSVTEKRIVSNADLDAFELSPSDMLALDSLGGSAN
jgi:2,5-diketo-D-gluconate reductase A